MRYAFDWDPKKATTNFTKHRVTFEEAMTVFRDLSALTMFDPDHSEAEERSRRATRNEERQYVQG